MALAAAVGSGHDGLGDWVAQCLERVGVLELAKKDVALLSGGERKRVQLATMLAGSPEVVLFDEPTVSLDPRNRIAVCRAIEEVFANLCRVVVSHDCALANDFADATVLTMSGGRLCFGSH